MIEEITGKLVQKKPTSCIVECQGIGFGIHISVNTFQKMESILPGESVHLLTFLHVREDALQLYGFFDLEEREMFQKLISVSGVGPKLALAILSGATASELREAILHNDVELLVRIPGVGRKTAQRLILELREKLGEAVEMSELTGTFAHGEEAQNEVSEAILALVSLGYKQHEARRALSKVLSRHGNHLPLEELIKLSLKEL